VDSFSIEKRTASRQPKQPMRGIKERAVSRRDLKNPIFLTSTYRKAKKRFPVARSDRYKAFLLDILKCFHYLG